VKSEPGAGSVSQEVMSHACSSAECQKHRLREVERGTEDPMTLQEEEVTRKGRKKKAREDGKIAKRDYVAFCDSCFAIFF
jgi:starvation-inducible outer membrane lipoprotein